ncbi:unnamed protein product [Effrenium voratum]|uniref:Uncharacterized protein n=1 Tax=Effrenium voratum TaxID=2562239 RepID=A0AA36HRA7_9DINO|nr:unnamed protein product [Effrenium voratum]
MLVPQPGTEGAVAWSCDRFGGPGPTALLMKGLVPEELPKRLHSCSEVVLVALSGETWALPEAPLPFSPALGEGRMELSAAAAAAAMRGSVRVMCEALSHIEAAIRAQDGAGREAVAVLVGTRIEGARIQRDDCTGICGILGVQRIGLKAGESMALVNVLEQEHLMETSQALRLRIKRLEKEKEDRAEAPEFRNAQVPRLRGEAAAVQAGPKDGLLDTRLLGDAGEAMEQAATVLREVNAKVGDMLQAKEKAAPRPQKNALCSFYKPLKRDAVDCLVAAELLRSGFEDAAEFSRVGSGQYQLGETGLRLWCYLEAGQLMARPVSEAEDQPPIEFAKFISNLAGSRHADPAK